MDTSSADMAPRQVMVEQDEQDMDPWIFADNFLFTVFRCHNSEWHYFSEYSASVQQSFDASIGIILIRSLWFVREGYFQSIIANGGLPSSLTNTTFNDLVKYASELYPTVVDLFPRLECVACLGQYYVNCGIDGARWWTFDYIKNEFSDYVPLLNALGR